MFSPVIVLAALGIGILIGAAGIGGVLLPPGLNGLGGVALHTAIPACMLAYLGSGAVGTWVYARRGTLDWRLAAGLGAGGAPGAYLGAYLLPHASAAALAWGIAALLVGGGWYALTGPRRDSSPPPSPPSPSPPSPSPPSLSPTSPSPLSSPPQSFKRGWRGLMSPSPPSPSPTSPSPTPSPSPRVLTLTGVGFVVGVGSALTGTGGPTLLLPLLVWLRVPMLTAVGLAQAIQLPVAALATLGNAAHGDIDWRLSAALAVALSAGVVAGAKVAHALPSATLARAVAVLLIAAGLLFAATLVWN